MAIEVGLVTAPAHWAPYLINGDPSGLSDEDIADCDSWAADMLPDTVVDVERDDDGEACEPRFTWSYRTYGGRHAGGNVIDYVTHRITE